MATANMNETLRGYLARAETINVDTLLVKKHYPFRVVQRHAHKTADGLVVDVYIITLADLDPRWMKRDPPMFECYHFTGTNECLIKVASFDYTYLFDQNAEEKGLTAANLNDTGDVDAINIARNQVLANSERHVRFYRLIFPEILNNEIFSPNSIDGKVKTKVYPMKGTWTSTFKQSDGTLKTVVQESLRFNIQWKIAVHEQECRNASAFTAKNDLMDKAESYFGSMSLS